MSKFSVITPVHLWNTYRVEMFLKTIESIKNQTFKDFEWVVVDDGSTMDFLWDKVSDAHKYVTIVRRPHEERVIAYNDAFSVSTGEWFVLLDSDDELALNALERMDQMIANYPEYKMFNFGCGYQHKGEDLRTRDPFEPELKKVGHEEFGGGNIVNGTFIWHRDVYEKLGAYPEAKLENIDCSEINYRNGAGEIKRDLFMGSPYDFAAAAQLEFPEMRKYFMVDVDSEPEKIVKELGNPWGQDYYLFYKYTRKFHSKPIKEYLYLVNPR